MLAQLRTKSPGLNLLVALFLAIHTGIAPLPWAHRHDLPTFGRPGAGIYREHILRWHQLANTIRPPSLHFHWIVFRSGVPVDGTMPDGPPGQEGQAEWVLSNAEGPQVAQTLSDWLAPCPWGDFLPFAFHLSDESPGLLRAPPGGRDGPIPRPATVRLHRWTC